MKAILEYTENNLIYMIVLLGVMVLAAVFWNLYRKEKKAAEKARAALKGGNKFLSSYRNNRKTAYIFISEKEFKVLYATPNLETVTGILPEDLKTDVQLLNRLVLRKEMRIIERKLQKWNRHEEFSSEMNYQKNGEKEMHRGKAQVQYCPEDGGYLLSLTDITEEYAVRRELEDKFATAQRESQSKTDFLSQMSHEIRTPMNGILGMLSLLKAHLGERAAAEEYLAKTESLSHFLLTLINDILDMSRIESGKVQLEKAPFSLEQLAEKLDSMFRSTAEAKGINWKIEMQDFDVKYVIGDEMRLSQVIINFISNANKFTPPGGTVQVLFRQMDRVGNDLHFMIRVKDTGKGIREDFISKIFRPFEQEDASTAHNYGGSGLGMAIADSMVKLMNGQILVESEEGKGTEFSVYLSLPIAEKQEGNVTAGLPESADDPAMAQALANFTLKGIRILLAEDNDINAEIAMEILAMEGAILTRACDGNEAVKLFKESRPYTYDVILMDIQMPGMDGWEATRVIRKMKREDADLPILAMSANAFLEDRRKSEESGMNAHINKPVDYDEVRRIIGEELWTVRSQH
ncbi:MAG: ATP-binding protein [Eubacteriales bacterium]|nr:ATP-binding protein [Eubacteriales bacterium]